MDSISAQGITNALRDAELLADAIASGMEGNLQAALADRHRRRDRAILPMYDFTLRLAEFAPGAIERLLLASLVDRPVEIDRFLGAFAGAIPTNEYFASRNVLRLLRGHGLLRLAGATIRHALGH